LGVLKNICGDEEGGQGFVRVGFININDVYNNDVGKGNAGL
jgi:hypothetical protein